ncbi:MAG: hypothetical protein PHR16_01580 [Methylovulum sp.]|nr:hypothetical protein [Methylovulum sp.]
MPCKPSPQAVPVGKSGTKTTSPPKNHGHPFEHNLAHGKQHLPNFLAILNPQAFLTHTALEWLNEGVPHSSARRLKAPSRRTSFGILRTLLQFIPFDSWRHLMQFMLNAGMESQIKT